MALWKPPQYNVSTSTCELHEAITIPKGLSKEYPTKIVYHNNNNEEFNKHFNSIWISKKRKKWKKDQQEHSVVVVIKKWKNTDTNTDDNNKVLKKLPNEIPLSNYNSFVPALTKNDYEPIRKKIDKVEEFMFVIKNQRNNQCCEISHDIIIKSNSRSLSASSASSSNKRHSKGSSTVTKPNSKFHYLNNSQVQGFEDESQTISQSTHATKF